MLHFFVGLKTKVIAYNPFYVLETKKLRKRLLQNDISIIASNCLGGLLYNRLGLRFLSPTINLMIPSNQFVQFVLHIDDYLKERLVFYESEYSYPTAYLGNLTVFFNHYPSKETAEDCWNKRKERIVKSKLFFILNDRDGVSDEDMQMLDNCSYKNILVFSSNPNNKHRCSFIIPTSKRYAGVDNVMKKSWLTGRMIAEEYFDFVGWFNQEKGSNLENYRRK